MFVLKIFLVCLASFHLPAESFAQGTLNLIEIESIMFRICYKIKINVFMSDLESGSIIPLYIYPTGEDSWQQLFEAYRAYPIETWAIVNVFNGPGNSKDSNYDSSIKKLHTAGIKTLGYVRTNYTVRGLSAVKADIDQWKRFYQVHGIFFDEMSNENNNGKIRYYKQANDYAKSKGFTFTVANPGTSPAAKYFDSVDNIVVFETDTGFPSKSKICSQNTNGKGRSSVSILPYNVANLNSTAVQEMKPCAKYVFVTDDGGNNPWDTLPNYLPELFQALKG